MTHDLTCISVRHDLNSRGQGHLLNTHIWRLK